ncbi:MAG TPA: hypothetical protein VGJ91_22980 [Polyangiaceae bacterium]
MSERQRLLVLVAALGLLAVEACSDSDKSPSPPTAGSAGMAQGTGGRAGAPAQAGAGAVVAGASNENAGQAGESTNDAGAAGAAGEAGSAGTATGGTAGTGGASNTFTLQTTTLGEVIGTASGFSLYVLKTDTAATATDPPVSTCTTTGCLATWPIYYGTPVSVPSGLLAADFGSYDRGAGVLQSTYKGWPLYTYAPDTAVGDVKGEGIGSKWYSVKLPFTAPGATTFTLQTTTLGSVIATADGFSLYVLTTDSVGTASAPPVSTCTTTGCVATWPIYYASAVSVPSGLLAADFGSYDRGGGVMQSTYKGWPLHTYAPDTAVGDVKGEGIGSKWYTAKSPFVLP